MQKELSFHLLRQKKAMTSSPSSEDHQKKVTVLYIEDDSANRQLVELILARREDIRFFEAETGNSGLDMAKQCQPDIILLDLSLPDISGFEVLTQLRNINGYEATPVIAVSGDNLPEDIQLGMQAGFHGYLTKPIIIAELYATLDQAIASLP